MENMNQILFSIIVPVYKVEDYLDKCIASIANQEFENYEIILVDDGSPDKCPEICDNWAKKKEHINVIHKKNGGSSSARNVGVRYAKGKYIIFVDSDDYWNNNSALSMIAETIERVKEVDVFVFNNIDYSCLSHESIICNRTYDIEFMENADKNDILKYLFNNNLFPGAAWVTVTRRKFLLANNIEFIEGIKAEDIDWLLNVYLNANRFSALNQAFYVYRKYRNDSITGTADVKSIKDILYILDIWTKRLQDSRYDKIRDVVYGYLCNHYMCAVLVYDKINVADKYSCKSKLKSYKAICKYSNSLGIKLARILPVSLLSKLLNIYRRKRRY